MTDPEKLEYLPDLKINKTMAEMFPNNCAVLEYTADGKCVGACWYYLSGGKCPRHGVVKIKEENHEHL